jgi:hypothetical protein
MSQSFTAMPTLVKNKVSRIVLSSLIVITALVVLGNLTGATVDEKLHIVIAISAAAAFAAGWFHEHLLTLAKQAEDTDTN